LIVLELADSQVPPPPGVTARAPRKNVMLAATISAGRACAPVRIRNLSEVGAMVDGAALPEAGTSLVLNRLALSVPASVVWSHDGRCGLRLARPIVVDDWIAGAESVAGSLAAGQTRVDQLQSAIRSGVVLPAEMAAPAPDPVTAIPLERRVAAELASLKRILDEVSDELIEEPEILARHERAMQKFDIAAMIIAELSKVLAAGDREAAVSTVEMHDLRSRLSGQQTLT
jgi:hypothetical protein